MAYTKVNWAENTPITAVNLNQMESGIANAYAPDNKPSPIDIGALPLTGGTIKGSLAVEGTTNGDIFASVGGSYRGLFRGLKDGGLEIHSYSNSGAWVNKLTLNSSGLTAPKIVNGDALTFTNQKGGGQMSSLINCQSLQTATGNGQMMTANNGTMYLGNPQTPLIIESSTNPTLRVGANTYTVYHTGYKPSPSSLGAVATSGADQTMTSGLAFSGKNISFTNTHGVYGKNTSGTNIPLIYMGSDNRIILGAGANTIKFEGSTLMRSGCAHWAYHSDGTQRKVASIGGAAGNVDLGDTGYLTAILSKAQPEWYNGSASEKLVSMASANANTRIRYGSGMTGAAGYITFSY